MVTLYGTPQWEAMSVGQQRELSRQQLVNMLSAGVWFENILNQALQAGIMHANPTAKSTHYMLTEMGDETRHMVMFGKTIDRVGGISVRPWLYQRHHQSAAVQPVSCSGGRQLVGEEIRCLAASDPRRPRHPANRPAADEDSCDRGSPASSSPGTACARRCRRCRGTARLWWLICMA